MGPSSQVEVRDPSRRRGNISYGVFQKQKYEFLADEARKSKRVSYQKRESRIGDRASSPGMAPGAG